MAEFLKKLKGKAKAKRSESTSTLLPGEVNHLVFLATFHFDFFLSLVLIQTFLYETIYSQEKGGKRMRSSKSEASSQLAAEGEAGTSTSGQRVLVEEEEEEEYELPTAERSIDLIREIQTVLVEGMKYMVFGSKKQSVLTHADAVKFKPVAFLFEDDGTTTPQHIMGHFFSSEDYVTLAIPQVRMNFCFWNQFNCQ